VKGVIRVQWKLVQIQTMCDLQVVSQRDRLSGKLGLALLSSGMREEKGMFCVQYTMRAINDILEDWKIY
jgi:hypothetical protein